MLHPVRTDLKRVHIERHLRGHGVLRRGTARCAGTIAGFIWVAIIHLENVPSLRVADRLGMRRDRIIDDEGVAGAVELAA